MKSPTKEERERWWLLCYAVTAMSKAKSACDLIHEHCDDWDHPLYEPLSLAVHVYYSRPFMNSFGVGRLENEIVPQGRRHTGIHKWLTHFRSSFMAHTDSTKDEIAGEPINDVVYYIKEGSLGFSTRCGRAEPAEYQKARSHCELMTDVFQDHLLEFYKKFRDLMPLADGEHLLCLDPDSPVFRLGHVTPRNATFHYKIE